MFGKKEMRILMVGLGTGILRLATLELILVQQRAVRTDM